MNITKVIQPIRLLSGTHANTGTTGQGCFMNVIAYLNGEPQITDESSCVCVTVRPIAIWLNDFMTNEERIALIPFIERAMGSATKDQAELSRRAWRAVKMAEEMRDLAASAESAARAASAASAASAAWAACAAWAARAERAAWAASAASAASAESAESAASAASAESRKQIIDSCMRFLDDVLPKTNSADQCVIERAHNLVALTEQSHG